MSFALRHFTPLLLVVAAPRLTGVADAPTLPDAALIAWQLQQPGAGIRGFTAEGARVEREWEAKFKAVPDPMRQRDLVRRLAARPHHVGSPYQRQNAEYMRELFASWGWDAKIEEYSVLFPTPKTRRLELIAPTRYVAKLEEAALKEDPATAFKAEQLPTYNAYSGDGDVTGPLVYVNYGVPADYEELERRGVSVRGAIVIARYGGSWRGIKPKVAFEHGAVGCIIYSDPRDDGYAQGAVYPAGPWRPRDGVQRGSVLDMPVAPGDPLTVGTGATADAPRIDRRDAATIMKIPVMPISYEDAQPLLAAMGGPVAPESWRGALPITYRLGGAGPARARLTLEHNWTQTPVLNVVATLRGSTAPDEWIVRGNHIDGWVNGAQDPIAGMAAELEEARALGELYKQGWRPKRTIVYTGWDAEEPALLGSTEWAEHHAAELRQKAVAYINTDGNGRGYLGAGGSHSLERFINEVARDVEDPETRLSVWRRQQAAALRNGSPVQKREARERADLRIGALGSGSDFTPFVQHLGIASLNLGFGGEDGGGIYHSIYDTPQWFERFSDTSFEYGRALSQVVGLAVMRLASADVLPYQFNNLAETIRGYVGEVKALRDETAARAIETNRLLDDGTIAATADPKDPVKPPARAVTVPHLNFAPLDNAVDALTRAAADYERAFAAATRTPPAVPVLQRANAMLRDVERTFTSPEGLPKRPWYKHLLYAPGLYTGYGVKTLPGVREGIELTDWDTTNREVTRLSSAIAAAAAHIAAITTVLEGK
ncbi:MAG: M28 family peptidase [Gemmatimonadaceae bacterium]|nr:M28 family peptidase [Gemmatimonadaceae bacterium]